MDHEVGPLKKIIFHSPTSCPAFTSNFLINQFAENLGPSLGVNQIWMKRNDHAPKNACVGFFFIYVQKGQFWKEKKSSLTILLSSLVFFEIKKFIKILL